MKRSKYPRFGHPTKHYSIQAQHQPTLPRCELCGERTVYGIHMEVDYMRGNDEFFRVCEHHKKLAQEDPIRFYEVYFAYQEKLKNEQTQQS